MRCPPWLVRYKALRTQRFLPGPGATGSRFPPWLVRYKALRTQLFLLVPRGDGYFFYSWLVRNFLAADGKASLKGGGVRADVPPWLVCDFAVSDTPTTTISPWLVHHAVAGHNWHGSRSSVARLRSRRFRRRRKFAFPIAGQGRERSGGRTAATEANSRPLMASPRFAGLDSLWQQNGGGKGCGVRLWRRRPRRRRQRRQRHAVAAAASRGVGCVEGRCGVAASGCGQNKQTNKRSNSSGNTSRNNSGNNNRNRSNNSSSSHPSDPGSRL